MVFSYLRESAAVGVGVRVGVHSGRVESAIVGLARWRYDVWSADVQLLEHVVNASLPGSVGCQYRRRSYVDAPGGNCLLVL